MRCAVVPMAFAAVVLLVAGCVDDSSGVGVTGSAIGVVSANGSPNGGGGPPTAVPPSGAGTIGPSTGGDASGGGSETDEVGSDPGAESPGANGSGPGGSDNYASDVDGLDTGVVDGGASAGFSLSGGASASNDGSSSSDTSGGGEADGAAFSNDGSQSDASGGESDPGARTTDPGDSPASGPSSGDGSADGAGSDNGGNSPEVGSGTEAAGGASGNDGSDNGTPVTGGPDSGDTGNDDSAGGSADAGGSESSPSVGAGSSNNEPDVDIGAVAITGSPPSQIMVGEPFVFMPIVENPNRITLTFTASNLPDWAMLDPYTGAISGEAAPADIGTYGGIQITVWSGAESVTSSPWTVQVVPAALGSAIVSWMPPTGRTDGSPLGGELSGYKLYYGQSRDSLNEAVTITNPSITNHVIDQLTPATWYFAVTAYDDQGRESAYSNIGSKTID